MSRLTSPTIIAARSPTTIRFDGETMPAYEGESVAAALTAAGRLTLRRTRDNQPRGVFCGIGVCHDCLVTVDGRSNVRACMAVVRSGMDIRSERHHSYLPGRDALPLAEPPEDGETAVRAVELLVVGAGPAGLSAAIAAASAGVSVVVVDERSSPGGQYFKPLSDVYSVRSLDSVDAQFRRGRDLVDAAVRAGVEIVTNAIVWGAAGPHELWVVAGGRALVFLPSQLVLATGAHERAWPVAGWTLPGVLTTGAAQTLARSHRVAPGSRVALCGNGPLNLQVAAELVDGGIKIAAVVEAASRPGIGRLSALATALRSAPALIGDGLRYLSKLRRAGVPVIWGHVIMGIEGTERVESILIAPTGHHGQSDASAVRRFDVDAVCLGYGFAPDTELARQIGCGHRTDSGAADVLVPDRDADGESSLPGVFIVGDGAGLGGAHVALAEGAIAGYRAAINLGRTLSKNDAHRVARCRVSLRRHRRFQKALWRLFDNRSATVPAPDDAVLCRCESVLHGEVRRLVASGISELGMLKKHTRVGMGRCQGRYCAPLLARLTSQDGARPIDAFAFFAPRPPLKPVPVAALAREKPEWSDYRCVPVPPIRPAVTGSARQGRSTDILVIGGGVLGASTAYHLAQAGCETLLVDVGAINSQSSGANGGSLHVQLTSKDFGERAGAASRRAADSLRLSKESVRLWAELAASADVDLEFKVAGGLMVTESEAELRYLEAKIALERRQGIDSELLTRADLEREAPYISDRMVGAELCREEGKINPLVATTMLARRAEAFGATLLPFTAVTGLAHSSNGYEAETTRGLVRARRVVNAAGAWSPSIAALLGVTLPVTGAPLQMLITEPAELFVPHVVAHAGRHLTLKQATNGGLIIGGAWPGSFDPATGRYGLLRDSIEGNLWVAQRVVPRLRHVRLLRAWAAMNVLTDGAPILGPIPRHPGFFVAVSVNGYTLAPILGRLLAELIATGKPSLDIRPYSIERFDAPREMI